MIGVKSALKAQLHVPNAIHIMMKTMMVPRQPPPSFLAPYPAIRARKKLFIIGKFYLVSDIAIAC